MVRGTAPVGGIEQMRCTLRYGHDHLYFYHVVRPLAYFHRRTTLEGLEADTNTAYGGWDGLAARRLYRGGGFYIEILNDRREDTGAEG